MERVDYPRHIGMIMDGNRRWAKQMGYSRVRGHYEGIRNIKHVIESCLELNIAVLSMYAFSTENWSRERSEVTALMNLMYVFLKQETAELHERGVQIRIIGQRNEIPGRVKKMIEFSETFTKNNQKMVLNIAFNYGGQQEIVYALHQNLAQAQGQIDIEAHLYTDGLPDVDLIVRTAGEQRISNFLLWQASNAYFYSTSLSWPEFKMPQLKEAVSAYSAYVQEEQNLLAQVKE